jgi:hypothetical protein
MNDNDNTSSTLMVHCGARKAAREELKEIPIPEGTRTHQPLSHYEIVEVLEEALSFRYLKVVRDEYAVSADGMRMFGVMDLNSGFEGGRFSIGLRNSNDKSMRLALTAGFRVFVCDNMAFSGDFTPLLHKHTRSLELRDCISVAVDRIQRGFGPLEKRIDAMREFALDDDAARLLIYRAFLDRGLRGVPRQLMPKVHENYFKPRFEEFHARNLWSLSNAFTSSFKELAPVKQFEVTARLGGYVDDLVQSIRKVVTAEQRIRPAPKSEDGPVVDDGEADNPHALHIPDQEEPATATEDGPTDHPDQITTELEDQFEEAVARAA